MEEFWGTWREESGAPQRSPMVHILERISSLLPKSLGSQSSSVYSMLLAAKPVVFTTVRVVCKPRCQTSCPRDSQLLTPNSSSAFPRKEKAAGNRRSVHAVASPFLSPHPEGRNFWDGQMVHLFFLLLAEAGVGRAGKTSATSLSAAQCPECPHTVATGATEWVSGTQGQRGPGRGGARRGAAVPPPAPQPTAQTVELAAESVTPATRRVQWLGMLLLRSLPLLLLLGAPRSFTEGAAMALTPEPVLEWQGECPPGRRNQIGSSGAGVVKAEVEGV